MATVTGGDRIAEVLREYGAKLGHLTETRVGFLENATYPDGTPVAMVAALNNFGAPEAGIPARPFFTNMVREKSSTWGESFAAVLRANEGDTGKAMPLMGAGIAGQLREAIVQGAGPANSPVTDLLFQRFPMGGQTFDDVQQARRDVRAGVTAPAKKPLSWTGHMLASVDHEEAA
ncbi:hypothetical protein [Novosphingobium olei]|uniref:Uncharacterized protein n=1 Tax=Novosphingobium olei TaxID=2728851 RepID=A0A7Y0G947_9SPHN|nr:hypothetical protein [Novosphingobium olei]NML93801.1 hypothetical protein [Novosphingobium olei]